MEKKVTVTKAQIIASLALASKAATNGFQEFSHDYTVCLDEQYIRTATNTVDYQLWYLTVYIKLILGVESGTQDE